MLRFIQETYWKIVGNIVMLAFFADPMVYTYKLCQDAVLLLGAIKYQRVDHEFPCDDQSHHTEWTRVLIIKQQRVRQWELI